MNAIGTMTVAELLDRIGDVPLSRIRMQPSPGTATEADLIELMDQANRVLCELVDGILIEKANGCPGAFAAAWVGYELGQWSHSGAGGVISGANGPFRIAPGRIRMPDAAYFPEHLLVDGFIPNEPICPLIPALVVEVLIAENRPDEMRRKRDDYFGAGVRLVCEIDLVSRLTTVYHSRTESITLAETDQWTGGDVLPGFTMNLTSIFSRLSR